MQSLKFRKAELTDLDRLLHLINLAYRENPIQSWTNEADYVSGQRINKLQLQQALMDDNYHLYVAEVEDVISTTSLIGCIGLAFNAKEVEIGTFCVDPVFQNTGVGKMILSFAETQALLIQPNLRLYMMYVLDIRSELIAYYQRRGYSLTQVRKPYPIDANVGTPLLNIELQQLIKHVS